MKAEAILELSDDPASQPLLVGALARYAEDAQAQRERSRLLKIARALSLFQQYRKELERAFEIGKTTGELVLHAHELNPKAFTDATYLFDQALETARSLNEQGNVAAVYFSQQRQIAEASADRAEDLRRRQDGFLDRHAISINRDADAAGRAAARKSIHEWAQEHTPELLELAHPRRVSARQVDELHLRRQFVNAGEAADSLTLTAAEARAKMAEVAQHVLAADYRTFSESQDPGRGLVKLQRLVGTLDSVADSYRRLHEQHLAVLNDLAFSEYSLEEKRLSAEALRAECAETARAVAGVRELIEAVLFDDEDVLQIVDADPHFGNSPASLELQRLLTGLREHDLSPIIYELEAHDRRLAAWQQTLAQSVALPELAPIDGISGVQVDVLEPAAFDPSVGDRG